MATRRRSPLVVESGSITLGEVIPLTPEEIQESGYGLPPLETEAESSEGPGLLRSVGDSGVALARGVVSGVRGITDIAGTDNTVSQALGRGIEFLDTLESPERRAERQRRAQLIKQAEETGEIGREVAAYLGSFVEAPLDTILEALGTSAPTLAAALASGPVGVGARLAMSGTIGGVQGAGFAKRQIAESVEQGLIEAGVAPEEAKARAIEAQSLGGPNTGQIIGAGALGVVAGRTGAEGAVARSLAKTSIAGSRAAQVLAATGGEFLTEAAQGGHEQFAGNIAQQREGLDVPLMQGVLGSAALEGVAGAGVGGGVSLLAGGQHPGEEAPGPSGRSIGEMLADAETPPAPGSADEPVTVRPAEDRDRPLPVRTRPEEFTEEQLARARADADRQLERTGEDHVVEIERGSLAVRKASQSKGSPVYSTAATEDPAETQARNARLLDQIRELAKDPLVLMPDGETDTGWRFGAMGKSRRGKRAASLLRRAQESGIPQADIAAAIAEGNAATKPASPRFDDPNAPREADPNALERAKVRAQALAEERGGRWVVAAIGDHEEGRYEAIPATRLKGRQVLFEVDGGQRDRGPAPTPSGRMEPGSNRARTAIDDRRRWESAEEADEFLRSQRKAGQSTFGAKVVQHPEGGFVTAFPDEPEFNDPAWQVQATPTPAPAPTPDTSPGPAEDGAASETPARGRKAQGQTPAAGPATSSIPAAGTPEPGSDAGNGFRHGPSRGMPTDGRVTQDSNLVAGATVVDADGRQYRVQSQEGGRVTAQPLADGQPQGEPARFWVDTRGVPESGTRTDPIYPAADTAPAVSPDTTPDSPDLGQSSPDMEGSPPDTTPDAAPMFATWKDAQAWIAEGAKRAGGKRRFEASPEYRAAYPQIRALFDAQAAASAAEAMDRMRAAGLKIGDRVQTFVPGAFLGGETYTGTLIERGGRPVVKIDGELTVSKNGRLRGVKSLDWDARWKKVEEEAAPAPADQAPAPSPSQSEESAESDRPAVDRSAQAQRRMAAARRVDPSRDTLIVAVARLGGIDRAQAASEWGLRPEELRHPSGVFGLPLFRKTGGRSIDDMRLALQEYGYLTDPDDHNELEDKITDGLSGIDHYAPEGAEAQAQAEHERRLEAEQDMAEQAELDDEALAEREAIEAESEAIDALDELDDDQLAAINGQLSEVGDETAQLDDAALDALAETAEAIARAESAQEAASGEESGPGARGSEEQGDREGLTPEEPAAPAPDPAPASLDPLAGIPGTGRIDGALAMRAFEGTSHTPERRGESAVREFENLMRSDYEALRTLAERHDKVDELEEAFAKYRDGYARRYNAYLAAHSRVMSAMIVGPARFPTERNRKRSDTADRRGNEAVEFREKALARMRRDILGRQSISSDDADAVTKLEAKFSGLQQAHETMKAANRIVRQRISNEEKIAALRELGFSAEHSAEILKPDFAGRVGFPAYQLANSNAEMARIRARIDQIIRQREAPAQGATFDGGRVVENAEANRLQILFDGKPDAEVRARLKANGFRWSPKAGAWQRQRGPQAWGAAQRALGVDLARSEDSPSGLEVRENEADGYQIDLFGEPVRATRARRSRRAEPAQPELLGDVQPAAAVQADPESGIQDTPTPEGQYYIRTFVGRTEPRRLAASRIRSAGDVARATRYLYESAVERMDGVLTDDDGRPLAVIGGFKGGPIYAPVVPLTLIGEAVRVPGATRVWFSHNHPSGTGELSPADHTLFDKLREPFWIAGIRPMGLIAIGDRTYSWTDGTGPRDEVLLPPPGNESVEVPVVDRDLSRERDIRSREALKTSEQAKLAARQFYDRQKGPGVMLLGPQHHIHGWVPLPDGYKGSVRGRIGRTLYRALSESNAARAIIVHGGELSKGIEHGRPMPWQNIAAALTAAEIRVLDSIDVTQKHSAAETILTIPATVFSRAVLESSGPNQGTLAKAHAARVQEVVAGIAGDWAIADRIDVLTTFDEAPEGVRRENEAQLAGGAAGVPRAYAWEGRIALVADQLHTASDIASALYHESTHFGLRGAFGPALDPILDEIARRRAGEVKRIARKYGLDFNNERQRRIAAEEMLAAMAESNPKAGFVTRALAAIRNVLDAVARRFGFDLELTDAQLISNFLLPAREYARHGGRARGVRIFGRTITPFRHSPGRREILRAGVAAASMAGDVLAARPAFADVLIGRARPLSVEALDQRVSTATERILRGNRSGGAQLEGGKVLQAAFAQMAKDGPAELRPLVEQIRPLLPQDNFLVQVDDTRRVNAHGAVSWDALPMLTLFTAQGRKGLTYDTILHEALHAAVLARYVKLSQAAVRSNDEILGVLPEQAERAIAQLTDLWREFGREVSAAKLPERGDLRTSLRTAAGSPDEFFVRMLTDPHLQQWAAGREYKGKTLLERFKDWVKSSLLGFRKEGTAPSWLDAGLAASQDVIAAMEAQPADFDRLRTTNRVRRESSREMRRDLDDEPQFSRAQTQTPEFRRWFGESETVDADGKPLVFFHDGPPDFTGIRPGGRFAGAIFARQGAPAGYSASPHALYVRGPILNLPQLAELLDSRQGRAALEKGLGRKLDDDAIELLAEALTDGSHYPSGKDVRSLIGAIDDADAQEEIQKLRGAVARELGFQAVRTPDEFDGETVMILSPDQIKSATGNNGDFDPTNPDIRFSRSPAQQLMQPGGPTPDAVDALGRGFTGMLMQNWKDSTRNSRSFKWWRGINTQYHKATLDSDFKRVFDAAQDFQKDVSRYANRAADLAPTLLPNIASAKDILRKARVKPEDMEKVAEAILAGTLEDADPAKGKVWTDTELRLTFGMNERQIGLYKEFRNATDQGLDDFGRSEIIRFADEHLDPLTRRAIMEAPGVRAAFHIVRRRLAEVSRGADKETRDAISNLRDRIEARVDRVEGLIKGGYAPLMRFGRHAVLITTRNEKGGLETQWFSLHDNVRDANRTAREMLEEIRREHPKAELRQGVASDEEHKLFAGVTPDTLQVFGDEAGFSDDPRWKKLIELTKSQRSALKRMLERKRTPGFSRDMTRVLAAFVTSQSRATAGNVHAGELVQAVRAIPQEKGDVKDDAVRLYQYLQNPTEEAQAIRGLLFTWFLGGSVASAAVNITQPLTMSLPYLAVKDGAAKASARILAAARDVIRGKYKPDTAKALKRAELEGGVVDPQEVHMLQAEVSRNLGASVRLRKAMFAWGYLFAAAERFNRRVTFVAAYEQAKELGSPDPIGDAELAVVDTQGIYNRCVDEATEILTPDGWKRFDEIAPGMPVYGIDDDGAVIADRLVDVHVYRRPTKVLRMASGSGLRFVTTPNHDHLVQAYSSRDRTWRGLRKVEAQNLKRSHHLLRVPLGDRLEHKAKWTDDEVRLFAWVASEGHLFAHRSCKVKRGVGLVQSARHNPQYVAEIDALLDRLGGHYNRKEGRGGEMVCWQLRKPLWSKIHEALPEKRVTPALLQALSTEQMRIFVDTFMKGDGHLANKGKGGNKITQKSVETLNTLHAMATLAGMPATIYPRMGKHDCGALYLAKTSRRAHMAAFKVEEGMEPLVWCPETTSGKWIMRRNGRTLLTGNSNRPNWARGAIPATVMTFKQFSIAYVEFVARLLKNKESRPAGLLALGILIMLSGLSGLPFMEDLDDIIDTVAQAAGYNFQSDAARQEFIAGLFGEQAADFALYGLSSIPGSPVDVQARLGLGNLIPGTAAFKKSGGPFAAGRETLEVFGAAGSLAEDAGDAIKALLEGEPGRAAKSFLPVAASNFAKGLDMLQTGMYRDTRGRKVIETGPADAFAKSLGFQPASVGRANRLERDVLGSNAIVRATEAQIAGQWATGVFEKDEAKIARARERLRDWNRNNPATPIRISPSQIRGRVRQMSLTRGERIVKSSPREVRAAAARALRQQE